MLRVGLTGGIAAGKSLAAEALVRHGAVLVDADVLAREVVEPGTPGLSAVAEAFGPAVLDSHGSLDRPALAAVVFGNEDRRATLNGIIHPLVRARAAEILAATEPGTVVVQDIPLLVETGQESGFHLVVVVEAPLEVRLERMVTQRGMSREAALARIAAQATDEQRRAAADVVIENTGTAGDLRRAVGQLWEQRIQPYNQNLLHARAAEPSPAPQRPGQPDAGPAAVARCAARLRRAAGPEATVTADAGTGGVVEANVTAPAADLPALSDALAAAGFPAAGPGKHGSADPFLPAHITVTAV